MEFQARRQRWKMKQPSHAALGRVLALSRRPFDLEERYTACSVSTYTIGTYEYAYLGFHIPSLYLPISQGPLNQGLWTTVATWAMSKSLNGLPVEIIVNVLESEVLDIDDVFAAQLVCYRDFQHQSGGDLNVHCGLRSAPNYVRPS